MGIVTNINEAARVQSLRESVIEAGVKVFEEGKGFDGKAYRDQYRSLGKRMESNEKADMRYRASMAMIMVERTKSIIDNMKRLHGESTVTQSFGNLQPRILDIVRIFYPNMIANELVDIQPLDGEIGQIFVLKPRFEDTFGGVTEGDEIFRTYPTNYNYAAETVNDVLGTPDGSTRAFSKTLANTPIRPSTVQLTYTTGGTTYTVTDDGNGNFTGTYVTGTVNYETGVVSITFAVSHAPTNSTTLPILYLYDSEQAESTIRSVKFDLSLVPVKARQHPLKFKYSVAAGLAASAHLALDTEETLTQLAAEYIKNERDNKLVQLIVQNATHDNDLDFDADRATAYYDKRSFYSELELKLNHAESLIQTAMGRGSVDFMLCGKNAAEVIMNSRGFRPEPYVPQIGSYKVGTLRDGKIAVVKSLLMDADTYVFGFKGFMPGDSATILAEWVPIYATPTLEYPTLTREKGLMSLYDLFVNTPQYYYYGTLTNYES